MTTVTLDSRTVERFFLVLVEELRARRPGAVGASFTVAEIYQSLVPYRSHRDRIGVELNGDYEEALLHLLGSEAGYLELDSDQARERIRRELATKNPNTAVFREYAALGVRIAPERVAALDPEAAVAEASDDVGAAEPPAEVPREDAPSADEPPVEATSAEESASDAPSPEAPLHAAPAQATPAQPPPATDPPANCPDCSKSLPDRPGTRFCPHCGANLQVVPCDACGEELERDWAFCVACGSPAGP
jgi:hypothetical protein